MNLISKSSEIYDMVVIHHCLILFLKFYANEICITRSMLRFEKKSYNFMITKFEILLSKNCNIFLVPFS